MVCGTGQSVVHWDQRRVKGSEAVEFTHYPAIVCIRALSMPGTVFGVEGNRLIHPIRRRCFQILFGLLIVTDCAERPAKMLREKSPVIPHVSVGCAAFDSGKETLEEVVSGGRTRWCMKISAVIGS